jgi:hypothetical protein
MNIQAFGKNQFYFLFFTNFESLFFCFYFFIFIFWTYYAPLDQFLWLQASSLNLWNPKQAAKNNSPPTVCTFFIIFRGNAVWAPFIPWMDYLPVCVPQWVSKAFDGWTLNYVHSRARRVGVVLDAPGTEQGHSFAGFLCWLTLRNQGIAEFGTARAFFQVEVWCYLKWARLLQSSKKQKIGLHKAWTCSWTWWWGHTGGPKIIVSPSQNALSSQSVHSS